MNGLFSFLLLIAITLLPWTQSALAEDQFPIKPLQTIAYVSYPPSGDTQANDNLFMLETKADYFYTSTGPLYTANGFRYTWICPDRASLVDNACYARSETENRVHLVNPSAAQVAFGYNIDQDSNTNAQLIFLANVTKVDVSLIDDSLEEGKNPCKNKRESLCSLCPDGSWVRPPTPCPR